MKHDVDYLKDESYRLIGAGFEVYNERGFGLAEELYQDLINFGKAGGLEYKRIILSEFLPK